MPSQLYIYGSLQCQKFDDYSSCILCTWIFDCYVQFFPSSFAVWTLESLLLLHHTGVTLTQISAHIMHKNLAVHKIMGEIHTAYTKSGTWSEPQTTHDHRRHHKYCDRKVCIVCERFVSLNRLMNPLEKVLLKCMICVSISFRWYAFLNFCAQISCPLAYGVRIPSKATMTADHSTVLLFRPHFKCCLTPTQLLRDATTLHTIPWAEHWAICGVPSVSAIDLHSWQRTPEGSQMWQLSRSHG